MKSYRQTASISAKDAEVGGDTGLTAHIEPYCGEDWPVSTNVYNSQNMVHAFDFSIEIEAQSGLAMNAHKSIFKRAR